VSRDKIAQMMQDSAGADWGTEAHFQRFAALVAAQEREACARIIEGEACAYSEPVWVVEIVNDIRARGEEPKRHPGYIIGDHWLQAAYTRICTGETEADVMADYGWKREA
jgi:hypothetical protein